MYRYIKGILTDKSLKQIVVECNGIGYDIGMVPSQINLLNLNKEIKVFTYLSVKENDMELFGFPLEEQLKLFKTLISISKIGPKTALNIMDMFTPDDFANIILKGDIQALSKVSGIGKKGAGRIILELKGKINFDDIDDDKISNSVASEFDYVKDVLKNMGFDDKNIKNVIKKIEKEFKDEKDEQKIMTFALKNVV
ncbi:MAG: Holliday junction branch migration protein RuvA [Candidatus Muirbacterium halophilum]|nr:Holliday junction branch migration protein RuvA [Candidatus Muirbacterium halophilum]MCK9475054.1 Holliday junction branch migration protein RuvA [Candidatus Muirbacterium halophilum]